MVSAQCKTAGRDGRLSGNKSDEELFDTTDQFLVKGSRVNGKPYFQGVSGRK
jgi:hypothetical protein